MDMCAAQQFHAAEELERAGMLLGCCSGVAVEHLGCAAAPGIPLALVLLPQRRRRWQPVLFMLCLIAFLKHCS
jgi:hypothetical protein